MIISYWVLYFSYKNVLPRETATRLKIATTVAWRATFARRAATMPPKPKWFSDLYGFEEGASFSENQAKFSMDGETLVCTSSPFPRQHVGPFETPSLAELRTRLLQAEAGFAAPGGLTFANLPAPEGVVPLILDPGNANAVFQAVRANHMASRPYHTCWAPLSGLAISPPFALCRMVLSLPSLLWFRLHACRRRSSIAWR